MTGGTSLESERYSGVVVDVSGKIRLDRYVAETLKLLSRSQIKSRVVEAAVNGKAVKLSRTVKTGDHLELSWLAGSPLYLTPESIPLDLLYEDDHCAVVNKAQGMVVHPGAGNHSGTLANALLWRRLSRGEGIASAENLRAGIVHRLDKDTSGVIIAAYDDDALSLLSAQFKERSVRKLYLAIVRGTPREAASSICTRIARDTRDRKRFTAQPLDGPGKIALTRYRVLKTWGNCSLILLKPKTGRTHQLRVHLDHLGNPIVGDPLYGPQDNHFPNTTLMLHAYSLTIVLPHRQESSCFKAPFPERFKEIIPK